MWLRARQHSPQESADTGPGSQRVDVPRRASTVEHDPACNDSDRPHERCARRHSHAGSVLPTEVRMSNRRRRRAKTDVAASVAEVGTARVA